MAAIRGIGRTNEAVTEIAVAIVEVDEQTAATCEIARTVQEAARANGAVYANIAGVGLRSTEAGAAPSQVSPPRPTSSSRPSCSTAPSPTS
ncbi:MAG TPA: hypothetical protein VIL69_12395 [Roseomonas sp.]|jgi:methyl-accepting chemotaxis protein